MRLGLVALCLIMLALVQSWETGEDPRVLHEGLAKRELAAAPAGGRSSDPQGRLGLVS